MSNLRIIAKSGYCYLVSDKDGVTLDDIFENAFMVDETGRMITPKMPIHLFIDEETKWERLSKNYDDVIKNRPLSELVNDALIGFAIGDAFGVPYEFLFRDEISNYKLKDMLGNNTEEKIDSRWGSIIPAGAWSDDTSMIVATMASFVRNNGSFDNDDIMKSFIAWWGEGKYASLDKPFGLGGVVYKALQSYINGVPPEKCGPSGFKDNGNGSLMRILPYSLYCIENNIPFDETCKIISEGSALTHGNDISKICCCIYTEFLRKCVETRNPVLAFDSLYGLDYTNYFSEEAVSIGNEITKGSLKYDGIDSLNEKNGYVVETLKGVFYSLLNGSNFENTIYEAVKIGYDTDTVAGITGAAAGIIYGIDDIPKNWMDTLRKKNNLENLALEFSKCLSKKKIDDNDKTR